MSNKTNIAPGVWQASVSLDPFMVWTDKRTICKQDAPSTFLGKSSDPSLLEQMINDMVLIAEAGTVTNECGKTPRELLELVRELRDAIIANIENDGICIGHTLASKINNIKNL